MFMIILLSIYKRNIYTTKEKEENGDGVYIYAGEGRQSKIKIG